MNTKKAFQKILVATMVASMAFASMVFASSNNTANVQEEKIEITVTSDIELVKRTRNEGAQIGSGNEYTETKISISDIKNGDAVFCEKDDSGKVTKIILLEKPERKEGDDQNKPQGRFGKGFDRATRSYASRAVSNLKKNKETIMAKKEMDKILHQKETELDLAWAWDKEIHHKMALHKEINLVQE